jgi:PAS domain S-box-containing protein
MLKCMAFLDDSLLSTAPELQADLEQLNAILEKLRGRSEALARERQRYADLFQLSPEAQLVTDGNGVILQANQAAATLLGAPQPVLKGKPLALFVAAEERRAFRSALLQLNARGEDAALRWRTAISRRRAAPVRAELSARSIDRAGPDAGYCWIVRTL